MQQNQDQPQMLEDVKGYAVLAMHAIDALAAPVQLVMRRRFGRRYLRAVALAGVLGGLPLWCASFHPPISRTDAVAAYCAWQALFWLFFIRALFSGSKDVPSGSVGCTLFRADTDPAVEFLYSAVLMVAFCAFDCPTVGFFVMVSWAASAVQASFIFARDERIVESMRDGELMTRQRMAMLRPQPRRRNRRG